jgi:phosphatidylserine/phosphatidylglycerophosphate/cardiolipin synthase-like enzyme
VSLQPGARLDVAFSPEAGAEALVLKVIDSAQRSLRLAGYSFTSPAVVRALVNARKRGVDVKVLLDDRGNRGNRGKASIAAMNLIADADIPVMVISSYAIHHDRYFVDDGRHTETGSCWRRRRSEPPCRFNIEPGLDAVRRTSVCG